MTLDEFGRIEKLHVLLDLAVRDGRKMLDDVRLLPAASSWVMPRRATRSDIWEQWYGMLGVGEETICTACLAGAVMVGSLGESVHHVGHPSDFYRGEGVEKRLYAINRLRCHDWPAAYEWVHGEMLPQADVHRLRVHEPPHSAHSGFRGRPEFREHLKSMDALADWLRVQNL